jgi:hypothetical protein
MPNDVVMPSIHCVKRTGGTRLPNEPYNLGIIRAAAFHLLPGSFHGGSELDRRLIWWSNLVIFSSLPVVQLET